MTRIWEVNHCNYTIELTIIRLQGGRPRKNAMLQCSFSPNEHAGTFIFVSVHRYGYEGVSVKMINDALWLEPMAPSIDHP